MSNSKNAPHLPKGTLTEWQKLRWKRLIWLCVTMVMSAGAGAVAAIWMVQGIASFFPEANNQTTIVLTNDTTPQDKFTLDPLVSAQVAQRIVHVYDQSKQTNGYVQKSAFVGQAVVMNAGGWAVLYANPETVNTNQWRNWRMVDFQGNTYPAKTIIPDAQARVVYVHIDGEGFRGDLRFADADFSEQQDALYAAIGEKIIAPLTITERTNIPTQNRVSFSSLSNVYPVVGPGNTGDPIVNPAGEFVGFLTGEKTLLGAWEVAAQLQSVLKDGALSRSDVSVEVTAVQAQQAVPRAARQVGYIVESTQGINPSSTSLQFRDVIISLEGKSVEGMDIERRILQANRALELQVIRNNETKTIEITF